MIQRVIPGKYRRTIQIPASKSDGQRALLAAALAQGTTRIHQLGESKDELSMLACIQQLGAKVTKHDQVLEVEGIVTFPQKCTLHVGESGLATRLLIGICAMHSGDFVVDGEGSLRTRSMDFFHSLFTNYGIDFHFSENNTLPLQFSGALKPGEIRVDGSQSSQYISGLLMGLPLLQGDSILIVENSVSTPYIQMTLNTLKSFGIEIQQTDNRYFISGNQSYTACTYVVEGDWSSASYWLVASALGQQITVRGLAMESLQADKALLQVFEKANCIVNVSEEGISIDGSQRVSFQFDATDCPDLFPALVTFSALTTGKTTIKGVRRLQNKESDRGSVLQFEFQKLGVRIDINEDEMHVFGQSEITGGKVTSHNDHRIAMCLGILGMFTTSPVEIEGAEAVAKSYPRFWEEVDCFE